LHGYQCALVQFIKGQWQCGETAFFSEQNACISSSQLSTLTMNTGFTWDTQNFDMDKRAADEVWQSTIPFFSDSQCKLIVLDEITYMFKYKYLDINEFIELLKNRPAEQNVIVTGRGAVKELIELADTVSEIKAVKHAFNQGIKAQKGIEW